MVLVADASVLEQIDGDSDCRHSFLSVSVCVLLCLSVVEIQRIHGHDCTCSAVQYEFSCVLPRNLLVGVQGAPVQILSLDLAISAWGTVLQTVVCS